MTNGDCVRQSDDEQIADFIIFIIKTANANANPPIKCEITDGFRKGLENYLKQEAQFKEEETTNET